MSNKRQAYNPFLPLNVCIPDGEPHVFGDRVYLYGSHDKEGGETFCMLDYEVWSAPVTDLTDWRCEGITYRAEQDPDYNERPFMYAPDVVRGNDGRYYLYYCMSGRDGVGGYYGPISVAVCDTPAGKYEYLGYVRYPDGTPMKKYVCFDPGVINVDGTVYVYYGTRYEFEEDYPDFEHNEQLIQQEMSMFGKSRDEILGTPESVMGPSVVTVGDDMLTITSEPRHIIPYKVNGTDFEGHPFFEAPSMRRVGDKFYFVYSSRQNHELCYAISDKPDRDFRFGGTIVSNGDVGYNGRPESERLNMTGTTHGSIEQINGKWYVFYHRLTHKSDYSRQACAEPIEIAPDGSIAQVPISSCGLNGGALRAEGRYPAGIACMITNGDMPHGCNRIFTDRVFPHCANDETDRYIGEITDGTLVGYRWFAFKGGETLTITLRGKSGRVKVTDGEGSHLGSGDFSAGDSWQRIAIPLNVAPGDRELRLTFSTELCDMLEIEFS
ncbi:MAG: family 43 glycosylhydrolase [Ruminococcus sp.]|nr:family 43 glycosylhydrolase [Ruminococcus sp.]